ncbi:hypothetical protein FRB94_008787 [Tulasnella sp. JGI-2019a]|nr:hypothetical protein FRB93_001242 [Tulasnella sp. JGI-2019a]KAG8995733.1 hypothetical protein FRB94_008787 [Tulasnella sp. JGI-2019a]
MLPTTADFVTATILGLVIIWVVKRAIVYRQATQLITLPGYRNLGPQNSSLYGLFHTKMLQHVEDKHIFAVRHLDYERFGWDVISSIYWFASKPRFFIADANIIQQIGASRTLFTKPTVAYELFNMFGHNVVTSEGAEWMRHRKVTSRAFTESSMQTVWKQTTRIVDEMFDSDWTHRGDVVAIDDVMGSTTQLSMLVLMAAGFGQDDHWINHSKPPSGHVLTFREALQDVIDNLILRVALPPWVWGSQASRDTLAIAGIAGRGWLGKQAQHTAVAFSELGKYMQEMLQEELATAPDGRERGTLFRDLVAALVTEKQEIAVGKNDLFGNMFIFLAAGFETTAHALGYALALLALEEAEQQQLYNHINDVLQDREPVFEDLPKLNRVQALFQETLRLYPAISELTKFVEDDVKFSVQAALSDSDVADTTTLNEKDGLRTEVFIPRGSEVLLDVLAVHHNPRYWPDPYTFNPDRFMDPKWPRNAFLSFSTGARSCMGRRFSETEFTAIITLIIRRYTVSIDPIRFPDIIGESKLQRRERVLKSSMSLDIRPSGAVPLLFKRR